MSRVLISTLALTVFSSSAVFAQPLNINPYPKASTLSSQGPEIMVQEPVDAFADEAEEEILRLEQENEALAKKLAEMQSQNIEPVVLPEPITLEKRESVVEDDSQKAIDLRAESKRLADELRIETEARRKQAELDLALSAMEAQKKVDMAADMPVELADADAKLNAVKVAKLDIDPLFESAAKQNDALHNPVKMTPMPVKAAQVEPNEVLAVRASDLGLVEPAAETPIVAPIPKQAASAPTITKIQVLPMPAEHKSASDYLAARPLYRTAQVGESLEDVLRSWSQAEGVGFLWKTTQRYGVVSSVSNDENYASSVGALLDQYDGQSVRPIGKLHTDPVTGFTTLSVFSE